MHRDGPKASWHADRLAETRVSLVWSPSSNLEIMPSLGVEGEEMTVNDGGERKGLTLGDGGKAADGGCYR